MPVPSNYNGSAPAREPHASLRDDPAVRLLSKRQLLDRVPLSFVSIWKLMRAGQFPVCAHDRLTTVLARGRSGRLDQQQTDAGVQEMTVTDPHKRKRPHTPNCASRTYHNDGAKIGAAVRAQQRAELMKYQGRTHTDQELREEYQKAMADKRGDSK